MVGSSANANNEQRFSKTSAQNNRMVGVVIKSPGTKSDIFSAESLSPLGYGSDHRTSKRPRTLQRFFRRCAATLSPSSLTRPGMRSRLSEIGISPIYKLDGGNASEVPQNRSALLSNRRIGNSSLLWLRQPWI